MTRVDVYFAAADVEEPDPDRAPLDDALAAAGITAEWPLWNAPDIDWSAAAVTYPRMTWDYYEDPSAFLQWAAQVAQVSRLRNPFDVIAWNIHKRYLVELAERGVSVVPTVIVERGSSVSVTDVCNEHGWERTVIKPAISCGSWETHLVASPGDGESHWSRLVAERDMMVQPYVDSVDTVGERCAVMIDGVVTHVLRKNPRFAGGVEATSGPFECTAEERRLIDAVMSEVDVTLDYARIDMVSDASGAPMLAELELIEPSLYFPYSQTALDRFVGVVRRHIQHA